MLFLLFLCILRLYYYLQAGVQASLLLKITAGQYTAVTGYSADLRSLIKRCLTQSPDRRPNTGDCA